jgi:hypothetical protein
MRAVSGAEEVTIEWASSAYEILETIAVFDGDFLVVVQSGALQGLSCATGRTLWSLERDWMHTSGGFQFGKVGPHVRIRSLWNYDAVVSRDGALVSLLPYEIEPGPTPETEWVCSPDWGNEYSDCLDPSGGRWRLEVADLEGRRLWSLVGDEYDVCPSV